MNMGHLTAVALLASSLSAGAASQARPAPVSLIQLIASPDKFDGKAVALQGFLVLGEHPEFFGQSAMLYVHQEDARNLLAGNSVYVVPTDQMRRERERIDQMYVSLTGVFRAAQGPSGPTIGIGTITEVQSCTPWSDPAHPKGDRKSSNGRRYK